MIKRMQKNRLVFGMLMTLTCLILIAVTFTPAPVHAATAPNEYLNVSYTSNPDAFNDGDIIVFSSNISSNIQMNDPKQRILAASTDWPNSSEDVVPCKDVTFSKYASNVLWAEYNGRLEYQVIKANKTHQGNQGYYLKNAWFSDYLDLKQDIQPAVDHTGDTSLFYKYSPSGNIPIYWHMYMTQPFVFRSSNARVWYWDASNREFYTLYTTPGYKPDRMNNWWPDPLYEKNSTQQALIGNVPVYYILLWTLDRTYNNYGDMGVYDDEYGFGEATNYTQYWRERNARDTKFILYGVNPSNKRYQSNGCNTACELHDPLFIFEYYPYTTAIMDTRILPETYYQGESDTSKSTASLCGYTDTFGFNYESDAVNVQKYADFEKVTVFKKIESPTITYDSNDSSGTTSQVKYCYRQPVDLSVQPSHTGDAEFLGWSETPTGPVLTSSFKVSESMTLYARWKFNVTAKADDSSHGTVTVTKPSSFDGKLENGKTFTVRADAEPGWVFAGWKLGDELIDGAKAIHQLTCDRPMNLTAQFMNTEQLRREHWTGNGSEHDPFILSDVDGWNEFAAFVDEGKSEEVEELYFALGSDIEVSRTAGDTGKRFCGYFDGCGHTITFNASVSADYCAPFRYIKDASFENLHTAGRIETDRKFAAGLAAHSKGTTTVTNCRSSMIIDSGCEGDGTHGGFIAVGDVLFEGCVFDGELLGENTTLCCGFLGWATNHSEFIDCLSAPAKLTLAAGYEPFSRHYLNVMKSSGYTKKLDREQGDAYYAVTTKDGVSIKRESGITYDVSNLTVYENGMEMNGVFYAPSKAVLTLTMSKIPPADKRLIATAGVLTGSAKSYKLVMPDSAVTVKLAAKKANTLAVKGKTAKVKVSAVKKKAQALAAAKVLTIKNKGQGKLTYTRISGNKKITINKTTGKVTVKKGLKKGTYKVKVKVNAAGDANYKAGTRNVTFTVKVVK